MTPLQELAPDDLRAVVATYRDVLRAHQEELNRLNVYPVPDGDTGTNMALTLESVCGELADAEPATGAKGMAAVCKAIAHGSLMGARGNSGVILSQILRGLAETFEPLEVVSARDVMRGLRRASDAAYEAVMRPMEGTILTVVRMAAEAVETAVKEGETTLTGVLDRAASAARAAVEQTPELLPVLRDAGVVDAGGRGFELLLHACLQVVAARPAPAPELVHTPAAVEAHLHHDPGASDLRYEVMYLLHAPDDRVPELQRVWSGLGDSIVVVGGDGLWNCHVHTNDIGGSIEAGIAVGRPEKIRVTDLVEQVEDLEELAWVMEHVGEASEPRPHVATAVVAVAVGDGLRRLLGSLGVHQVIAGGQSMNPSTSQILEAVEECDADAVIVLPNNKNIIAVARQVAGLTDTPVVVVPTTTVMEALTALVGYDPDAPVDVNAAGMEEATERVRAGEITRAVRNSVAECGPIAAGDWIAVSGDGVRAAEPSVADAAIALLGELLDGDAELVTLITGADARLADTARIEAYLDREHPDVEIELHEGDQPLYPYLIGVE